MIAFEMLVAEPAMLALVVAGVGFALVVVLLAARAQQRLDEQSQLLLGLALTGRADEARIQARQNPRDLGPMLSALGGRLTPPSPRPVARDLVAVIGVSTFPLLAVVGGWQASLSPSAGARVTGIAASFAAFAVLLPTAVAATTLVISLGRRAARVVRGAAVQLLARGVKAAVDAELLDNLRRRSSRDPRGE